MRDLSWMEIGWVLLILLSLIAMIIHDDYWKK
jgi:hypothetical protein